MPQRTDELGTPLIPAGGVAQSETVHNEAIRRVEVLACAFAHAIRSVPTGGEANGEVVIVASPATGAFEDQDNKIAFKFGGSWRFIPDVTSSGAAIPIGVRHAGLRFFVQDLGDSPSTAGWRLWNGAAWVAD